MSVFTPPSGSVRKHIRPGSVTGLRRIRSGFSVEVCLQIYKCSVFQSDMILNQFGIFQ